MSVRFSVFVAAQSVAVYAYPALFNASHGEHRLLFLIAAIGIVASLAIDSVVIAVVIAEREHEADAERHLPDVLDEFRPEVFEKAAHHNCRRVA